MKKIIVSVFALTMVALVSNGAMATVPDLIPIQGVLADDVGAPVDGATDITFALYAAETGGSALWTDPFTGVDVVDGFFTVYLGSQTTLDLTAYLTNAEIWLGINVEGDGEMDRIQLATVPFAIQAQVCQAVGSLTESDINTNFSPSAHNHDAAYAAIGHNHDAAYAAISHNHDLAYAPITHTHAWSDITSGMPAGFSDGVDNDSGGDITGVTAGAGLTGGGTTGAVTLTLDQANIYQLGTVVVTGSSTVTTVANMDRIIVTAPSAGRVLLTLEASGWLDCDSAAATARMCSGHNVAICSVTATTANASCDNSGSSAFYFEDPDNTNSFNEESLITRTAQFPVVAGVNYFYINGMSAVAGMTFAINGKVTALFIAGGGAATITNG